MAVDHATLERMKVVKQALEAAVTAALPLAASDASFREQVLDLDRSSREADANAYYERYLALGKIAERRSSDDRDFKYALTVLGVEPGTDYGLSVLLAATQTANLVVLVSQLLHCSPEEVWQNYLFNDDNVEGI